VYALVQRNQALFLIEVERARITSALNRSVRQSSAVAAVPVVTWG
jgi:hypothetical protein